MKPKDLTGQRFGKLVVLHRSINDGYKGTQRTVRWKCKCDCGTVCIKDIYSFGRRRCSILQTLRISLELVPTVDSNGVKIT
jgi:hypothetical protein